MSLWCVADIVRHASQMTQQLDIIRKLPSQSLVPMLDGVNVVSNCAWTVNQPVSRAATLFSAHFLRLVVSLYIYGRRRPQKVWNSALEDQSYVQWWRWRSLLKWF